MKQQDLARALGWFSIGLGVAELLAPRKLEKAIGVKKKHNGLTRSYGLRELTAGIGLLTADSKETQSLDVVPCRRRRARPRLPRFGDLRRNEITKANSLSPQPQCWV